MNRAKSDRKVRPLAFNLYLHNKDSPNNYPVAMMAQTPLK